MKIQHLLFFTITIFFTSAFHAQTNNSEWSPVLNNYDGTNINEGVEATCKLSKCDNEDVVIFKLENKNSRKLRATWKHMIETTSGEKLKGNEQEISLMLTPNTQRVGECNDAVIQLRIKLSDFGITAEKFQYYIARDFHLNVVE